MLLLLALTATVPTEVGMAKKAAEAAYIAGWCDEWTDQRTRDEIRNSMDGIDQRLWRFYNEGMRQARKDRLTPEGCAMMLRDLQVELQAMAEDYLRHRKNKMH